MDPSLLSRPTVVLCPPLAPDTSHPEWVDRLAAALRADGVSVLAPAHTPGPGNVGGSPSGSPSAAEDRLAVAGWVADQAIAVTAARAEGPLVLVAHGSATRGLPALGMSQRAARHNVVGYVLVDGPLPAPSRAGTDWPDAPVLYVRSSDAAHEAHRQAGLRGWDTAQGDPAGPVLARVLGWPDQR